MKKFLIKIGYTVFPLWLAIIGLVCFYYFVVVPNMQGGLGRLGKIPTRLFYERDSDYNMHDIHFPTIQKIESIKNDTFDIITCGDSFSQQGLNGFQNYMSLKGLSIVNYFPFGPLRWNAFQSAFDLINLGYIDSTNVKMIIIESVERSLYSRLCDIDFSHDTLDEGNKETRSSSKNWSLSLSEAKTFLDFQLGLKESPVKQLKMNKSLFSGSSGNSLYFYYEDTMESGFSIPKDSYNKIKNNIDFLFKKAFSKGIRIIILVCPDKYDMYQDYVDNNPYPKKTVNEDLRKIVGDKENVVIGKEILLPHIYNEEKDMYYLDGTHWTYKSAKIIADTLTNIYHKTILKSNEKPL